MTAKRFTYDYEDDKYYDKGFFKDKGKELYKDELLELLNTLHEENENYKSRCSVLEQENENLKKDLEHCANIFTDEGKNVLLSLR